MSAVTACTASCAAAAGIDFEGGTYGESFVLADVRMQWSLGTSEVSLFFSPAGVVVVAPLPMARSALSPPSTTRRNSQASRIFRDCLIARTTTGHNRIEEIVWSSRFRVHHRVAKSYSKGSFILMGDAAHVHSPAGGQGMNTGIVDAVVLGRLLADVVKGKRPESPSPVMEKCAVLLQRKFWGWPDCSPTWQPSRAPPNARCEMPCCR